MPNRNRVLVIDDKREDGEAVIRRLWEHQVPCYFLHYSEDAVTELLPEKKFSGIRIIFQDIALLSHSHPGHSDYTAAATGISRLLHNENGPWLLVAWSTWGEDPDLGDQYARELFEHLCDRLPQGIRPFKFVVLDKSPYTSGLHSSVKAENDLEQVEKQKLLIAVKSVMSSVSNLAALSEWEHDIRASASGIVHDLWGMAATTVQDRDLADQLLGGILDSLAKAEDATLGDGDNIAHPLYQILSKLLYDKSCHVASSQIQVLNPQKQNIPTEKLNTMLHWDSSTLQISPGSIFRWPINDSVNLGTLSISNENLKEFIVDAFIDPKATAKRDAALGDSDFLSNTTLVLIDITPACDHANKKAFWRRFLVGIKVKIEGKNHFTQKGKLPFDNLKETPTFEDSYGKFSYIFNSKLAVSLSDKNEYQSERNGSYQNSFSPDVSKLEHIGRVRNELLQEIQFWYGRMASRPGIVSL